MSFQMMECSHFSGQLVEDLKGNFFPPYSTKTDNLANFKL